MIVKFAEQNLLKHRGSALSVRNLKRGVRRTESGVSFERPLHVESHDDAIGVKQGERSGRRLGMKGGKREIKKLHKRQSDVESTRESGQSPLFALNAASEQYIKAVISFWFDSPLFFFFPKLA